MRILIKRDDVLQALNTARELQCPVFCPNAQSPDEIEGLLLAASDFGSRTGQQNVTIGMGITSSYPDHPQLVRLAADDATDLRPTLHTWLSWIRSYANRPGFFDGVSIIPFLDHGWAADPRDVQLMMDQQVQDALGIIMFDASVYDLKRNIQLTRDYVQQAGGHVVVEACPDKILSEADILAKGLSASDMLTDPASAASFVNQTGVDLIVPNLGTEHRATGHDVQYHAEIAQALQQQVGSKLALHGTSSLGGRIGHIAADGIVKVNFYTAMARSASQRLRDTWDPLPAGEPMPITHTCGSHVHGIRRDAVRQVALDMLQRLQSAINTQSNETSLASG